MSLLPNPAQDLATRRERLLALTQSMPHAVWRGDSIGRRHCRAVPTGYQALDAELPDAGWPPFAITEVLWSHQGSGEIRLLTPALQRISAASRSIVVIGSPHRLMAPAFEQYGINIDSVLSVDVDKPADRLWAAEQVLKSASAGAILVWLQQASAEHLRRLQVAASGCDALAFVFRPAAVRAEASPAPLRLQCQAALYGQLDVDVFKRRGPAGTGPVTLPPLFLPSMSRALLRAREIGTDHPEFANVVDRRISSSLAARPRVPTLA